MSERFIKYRFLGRFLPNSSKRSIVVLTGARQTGKTTLAKATYPLLNYVNLDAPENREVLRNISTPSWAATVRNAVIDEAQKEPSVFEKVKYAFDMGTVTFTVLLGSSQILLLKKVRESLAGRVGLYELWPLMMSEIDTHSGKTDWAVPLFDEVLTGPPLDEVLRRAAPALLGEDEDARIRAENYLLKWGGMPALLSVENDEERWKWLRDYEYTYLERDLSDLARLDDLGPFTKFQRLSALRSGQLLNYSELARDASISVDTARRYLEYLRLSYQVILLQPYFRNLTSSVVKTPKLYWLDIGLLRQMSGRREETGGEIYESLVVSEVVKWIRTAQRNAEVFFYRTRGGLELDMLIGLEGGRYLGMEIKGRRTIVPKDIKPLKAVADALGKAWAGGMIVYRGDEIRKLADPSIWAVPSRRLFTRAETPSS
jgi:predicted AAA+ superfamily ATPase